MLALSWQQLASTNTADFHYVNKIVVSPNNGQRVYAATRTGVWRSLDGGSTWSQVLNPGAVNGCLDLGGPHRPDDGLRLCRVRDLRQATYTAMWMQGVTVRGPQC